MTQNVNKESLLTLQNRKILTLTGVQKVVSINENQAKIELNDSTLLIFGREMKMKKLSVDEGEVIIDGVFDGFKYATQKEKGSFFKRLFK